MKKIFILLCCVISIYSAQGQLVKLPKENQQIVNSTRDILLQRTKLDVAVVNRACYMMENFELQKIQLRKKLADKPTEMADALAKISVQKLNNLKGVMPADQFALLTAKDIAFITQ
jgi:hypothetical protein